jgi:hypothetical protein
MKGKKSIKVSKWSGHDSVKTFEKKFPKKVKRMKVK